MIPLRDANPSRSVPLGTYALLALNTATFAYQSTLDPEAYVGFMFRYGLTPIELVELHEYDALTKPLTSLFLHGSWAALLFNLWFLVVFGRNVEAALGRVRLLAYYLGFGLAGAALQVLIDPLSEVPLIGASGAIAGVLGAYLKLFPQGRVLAFVPLLFSWVRDLPAVFFVVVWFVLQLVGGFSALSGPAPGGSAFFAHIGGFLCAVWLVSAVPAALPNATRGFRRPEYD